MSTPDRTRHAFGLAAGAATIVTLFVLVHPHNASLANGLAWGGGLALAGAAVAFVRVHRAASTTSVERAISGVADERDARLADRSLAVAGWASFLWMAGDVLAVGVGADAAIASAVMVWGQLLTLVGAYLWHRRRM